MSGVTDGGSVTPSGKTNEPRPLSNEFDLGGLNPGGGGNFNSIEADDDGSTTSSGWNFLGIRLGDRTAPPGDACGGSGCDDATSAGSGGATLT
mmetsp:Transcript_332/g.721  ORF Transcript_332/g.721 Transcript_332/m.721 type:complete len:93 (-) Transcript_332:640-918(-)